MEILFSKRSRFKNAEAALKFIKDNGFEKYKELYNINYKICNPCNLGMSAKPPEVQSKNILGVLWMNIKIFLGLVKYKYDPHSNMSPGLEFIRKYGSRTYNRLIFMWSKNENKQANRICRAVRLENRG